MVKKLPGYGFLKMTSLELFNCESIIELDLLMKPDYFPALELLYLSGTNIITIPESISRFPRLTRLSIEGCKHLREVQGLPLSINTVYAENCPLLDNESPSGLLNQVSLFLLVIKKQFLLLSLNALRDLVNEKC